MNIVCTQPRQVSALCVATRVAGERLENIDDKDGLVGYTIRGKKKLGPQTTVQDLYLEDYLYCLDYTVPSNFNLSLVTKKPCNEVDLTCKAIESLFGLQVKCLQLHSQLSNAEQKEVFGTVKPPIIKVVVATNIAETSITIPDVKYVIDNGQEKQIMLDAEIGISKLTEINCSHAAAKQRHGRAGRTGLVPTSKSHMRVGGHSNFFKGAILPPPQLAMEQALLGKSWCLSWWSSDSIGKASCSPSTGSSSWETSHFWSDF
ncbi:hypothetical protein CROQUDRAFT_134264 [Cronartium quercuum f. sp. fusiforme G11]|uniref:Helicase C-terminal domain-containing protein n=1 Tax=Cronartium quercuum f. sp. fusiforme G11 TaxID=708437 RepID=A0A9P6NI82_9BASI|nr:hypothetical protein CROQUDRAFT_134264 [Cronartium quercuum f. sp. fusiforme G11]